MFQPEKAPGEGKKLGGGGGGIKRTTGHVVLHFNKQVKGGGRQWFQFRKIKQVLGKFLEGMGQKR